MSRGGEMKTIIEIESTSNDKWWAKYSAGHGGKEFRAESFDEMIDRIRELHAGLGGSPPAPPALPEPPAAIAPMLPDSPPRPLGPNGLPRPIGKREAARMRHERDEAILATMSDESRESAMTRRAQAGGRRR